MVVLLPPVLNFGKCMSNSFLFLGSIVFILKD
jgi:hypothetical protein